VSEGENDGPVDVKDLVRWAERTHRNLEFLAGQQAQFSADLQQSREEQKEKWQEQQERWKKADARWAETEKGIRALLAIAEIHEKGIAAMAAAQAASQERTDKQLAGTGERVDALVNTVERLISERRDGGADTSGVAREG
jgi:hypothetical protein